MTIEKIKKDGTYIGFSEGIGYVYSLNENMYALGKKGIINITHLNLVS